MPNNENLAIGTVVKRLRKAAGINLTTMAEKTDASTDVIASIENGSFEGDPDPILEEIVTVLGLDLDKLRDFTNTLAEIPPEELKKIAKNA